MLFLENLCLHNFTKSIVHKIHVFVSLGNLIYSFYSHLFLKKTGAMLILENLCLHNFTKGLFIIYMFL